MLIQSQKDGFIHPLASEITAPQVVADRRALLVQMATGVAGLSMASWASRQALAQGASAIEKPGK